MASIYISPSTQEHNIGVGGYGSEEMRMNQIADVVCKCLEASKVTHYRNKPNMSLAQVVADSNSKNVDIHFAIHSNAGGGRGAEVHVYRLGEASEKFAHTVYSKLSPLTPSADRGIKVSPKLYELNATKAQAALLEVAFHDNPADAAFIMNNIQNIGVALAEGICQFFSIPFVNPYAVPAPAPVSDTLYRVQVGAYRNKANAVAMANRLRAAGYDALITTVK